MLKKHLTSFNDNNEYFDFVLSKDLINPNISLIKAINKIIFKINHNHEFTLAEIEEFKNKFANCKFMYEDSNHNIISNFKEIDVNELLAFNEYNIYPDEFSFIGVYNNEIRIGYVKKVLTDIDSPSCLQYKVGLMSDVHYNDTTVDNYDYTWNDDGTQYRDDIINALQVYQNNESVRFICISGDISSDSITHILNFKKIINNYSPNTDIYACLGNHDYRATSELDELGSYYNEMGFDVENMNRLSVWNSLLTPTNSKYEIHYQDKYSEYGKTSYYFEVPIANTSKSDIYVFLSLNYLSEENRENNIESSLNKINQSYISINTEKSGYDENNCQEFLQTDNEYNVALLYTNASQSFVFNCTNIPNYTNNVIINNCKIYDGNDNDITDYIFDNPKIGIYGSNSQYYISGKCNANMFKFNGDDHIEFTISSSFKTVHSDVVFPVKLYMNIDLISGKQTNPTTIANHILTNESPYMSDIIDYVGYMPVSYNLKFYDNAALLWLKNIFERYSDKRIFVFTHQFFIHKAGSNNSNNLYSYGGDNWRITPNSAYCLCGIQFEFLNKLNNEYKNAIWFTGHSHYKWNWQTIDSHININNNEYNIYRPESDDRDFSNELRYMRKSDNPISKSAYNVHIPSTVRPLKFSSSYSIAGEDSEGAIMEVYENYVKIKGIIFKEGENGYINKYYPLSQYVINIKAA